MIKHILFTVATLGLLSPFVVSASDTHEFQQSSEISLNPQICMFSLSSYSGTISESGYTANFTVNLSCPDEEDQQCTVTVVIDGYREASKVVTIPAGKTTSGSTCIKVDTRFKGKNYRLSVL